MPSINTNVAAIKARSNLERVQRDMDTSIARLSSGKRITRAADDAAEQRAWKRQHPGAEYDYSFSVNFS